MLVDDIKMAIMKQGTDNSRPSAQISGSIYGTLSRNDLDNAVPIHPPRTPVTLVTTPKI